MSAFWLGLALQLQLPAPVGYVNDFAGIVDSGSRAAMTTVIDEVRTKSGGEIVVVTLRDLAGRASIDVARDIGRQWRVGVQAAPGDSRRNTGVVLLLVPGERPGDGRAEVAIATGSGAEGFVTDAAAGRIRDALGRAAVERQSYAAGLVVAAAMLADLYAREFGFELTGRVSIERPRPAGRTVNPMLIALAVGIFFLMASAGGRRRRRGGLLEALLWGAILSGGRRGGGWHGGGWGGGGFGGGGGGFGGFGGGGGFSGGGASGRF